MFLTQVEKDDYMGSANQGSFITLFSLKYVKSKQAEYTAGLNTECITLNDLKALC